MKRPWLAPLVPLYAAGVALRDLRLRRCWETAQRLQWPVISVGNLSAGGAGKTPFTIALAELLQQQGFQVDVLSRGYGRASSETARVLPDGAAETFGDEPLLIARQAGVPVYVAPRRYDAGLLAEADFAALHAGALSRGMLVHVLDDGFQHRQLARDIDILLLNEADLRDSLLPAGNLREPLRAMQRADIIAVPAEDAAAESDLRHRVWRGPVWRFRRRMEVPATEGPVVAFCGIARPAQFFAGLETAGMRIASRERFRDHHPYTVTDVARLAKAAQSAGATALVTTEKDRVRIGNLAASLPKGIALMTASFFVEIDNPHGLLSWLEQRLAAHSSHQPL